MRAIFATVLVVPLAASSLAQAADSRLVKSAPQRWAADGSGGAPNFIRHVVPLLSKLGCNMRSCHGSFQGQNGFRLSLFGFEPDLDRKELFEIDELSEGEGPRVNLKDAAKSLFLTKPTATEEEHGGGKRMGKESWQYRVLLDWIKDGATYDPPKTVKLVRLETDPAEIIFTDRKQSTQLRAIAWFDDGTHEDVTGLTPVVQQTLGHACSTVSEVDFDTTSDETSMSFSSQTSVREFRMNQKKESAPEMVRRQYSRSGGAS
jgi:hypothetical protein